MFNVLNNSIEFYGARFVTTTANILEPINVNVYQERFNMFLEVFEQLMLFDNIIVKTSPENVPLLILIEEFGLNRTEELLDRGQIKFLIWIPYLFCEMGKRKGGPIVRIYGSESEEDSYDDSELTDTPPLFVSEKTCFSKLYNT